MRRGSKVNFDLFSHLAKGTAESIAAITAIIAAILGAGRWASRQHRLLQNIANEFLPNGGSSLRDQNNRIEATLNASLRMTGRPFWRSDSQGVATYISPVLAQVMGGSQEQFVQNGWIGAVPESDRTRVVDAWMKAVQDNREFDCRYAYQHPDGTLVPVHGYAIPLVVDSAGEAPRRVIGYLGWVEVL